MANKYMNKLLKLEGAVVERRNVHATVVGTKSPSFNFTFGKGWGLPFGYSMLLFGPPKGGKSLIVNAMIAQLHADYPEAMAIKYNTEMREEGQLSNLQAKTWGIDMERYVGYDTNSPDFIFDPIEKDVAEICQDGGQIRLVIVDSVNSIKGRRSMNATTVMQQQIGDLALTLGDGLKRILSVQRKYGFALVLCAQIRAEMDQLEQMRGNKWKAAVPQAVLHHCEYFGWVERDQSKEGKADLLGNKFVDKERTDLNDNAERTGHKIKFCMRDSSMGPKGRVGEFTFDYDRGIVSQYEEVFLLGLNRGVIEKPNNLTYKFGDRKWSGKPAMLQALKEDTDLQKAILQVLRERDVAGMFAAQDAKDEAAVADLTEPVAEETEAEAK